MSPGPQYPSPDIGSPEPSNVSTTGYTDQTVLHAIVLVMFIRTKFWLNNFAQHAPSPKPCPPLHQSSELQSFFPQVDTTCAALRLLHG